MFDYWPAMSMILATFLSAATSYLNNKNLRWVVVGVIWVMSATQSFLIISTGFWVLAGLIVFWIAQGFNFFRSAEKRYQADNTAKRVVKTGLNISALCLLYIFLTSTNSTNLILLTIFYSCLIFIFGLVAIYSIKQNLFYFTKDKNITDTDLPTVSVLIPARDEDENLSECINSVLSSDYPKLEIIVLDDCSQDKSSEIIRSFAQRGVRFIQGDEPKDNWLAKNQAYEVLAKSASGQWLVFMGVDTRIKNQTIRKFIINLLNNNMTMACAMPQVSSVHLDGLFMPLRIFWELALPNSIKRFPPSISTFWAIHKEEFNALGGFGAVSQSVLPERYFAKKLSTKKQYAFAYIDKSSNIETRKNLKDHLDTSRRLLYPQLKKSYSKLVIITILGFLAILQLIYSAGLLMGGNYLVLASALLAYMPLFYGFMRLAKLQGYNNTLLRTLLLPYLLIRELALVHHSAYNYEYSDVMWKGRNVCYPALKVIPKLPKL